MRGRTIALAVLAAAVLGGGVWLAIAVRSSSAPATPAPAQQRPAAPGPTERVAPAAPDPQRASPPGPQATAPAADPEQRFPIPDGGFAAWTGREGLAPGEIEDLAKASGVRVELALEERRSAQLAERTSDNVVLGELLGSEPTGYMLATIGTQAKLLREAAAAVQSGYRDGKLDDVTALRQLRAAQDTYRAAYLRVTGLTDPQFERFFARDRPLR